MGAYLDRYQQGEYQQVWDELIALGTAIKDDAAVYEDALAVARETMRRARQNIETIYQRLQAAGYQFEFPEHVYTPPQSADQEQMRLFKQAGGHVPLSVQAWIEEVGSVNFMGTHPHFAYFAPHQLPNIDIEGLFNMAEGMTDKLAQFGIGADMIDQVRDLVNKEKSRQPLPDDQIVYSDPLVIEFDLDADDYQEWKRDCELEGIDEPYYLPFLPDADMKSNQVGMYDEMILPDHAAADAEIDVYYDDDEDTCFVGYLRHVFKWGGFPGLAEAEDYDQALLDKLREGLLPL